MLPPLAGNDKPRYIGRGRDMVHSSFQLRAHVSGGVAGSPVGLLKTKVDVGVAAAVASLGSTASSLSTGSLGLRPPRPAYRDGAMSSAASGRRKYTARRASS